jgi:hypothetical protein
VCQKPTTGRRSTRATVLAGQVGGEVRRAGRVTGDDASIRELSPGEVRLAPTLAYLGARCSPFSRTARSGLGPSIKLGRQTRAGSQHRVRQTWGSSVAPHAGYGRGRIDVAGVVMARVTTGLIGHRAVVRCSSAIDQLFKAPPPSSALPPGHRWCGQAELHHRRVAGSRITGLHEAVSRALLRAPDARSRGRLSSAGRSDGVRARRVFGARAVQVRSMMRCSKA